MQLTMPGILLKRIQLKENDEKLFFFTDKMGRVDKPHLKTPPTKD